MPLGDIVRRRHKEEGACPACGQGVPEGATYCPSCGIRIDDPEAQPLHIVDRATGLFNDRFIRPILEDELARAHRYSRPLGILLVEARHSGSDVRKTEEVLRAMAGAIASTLRDVDTPGVLHRTPPQLLGLLPDTDMAGTAHAATRVLQACRQALHPLGVDCGVGLVCVRPTQRFRAGAVIESASRSLQSGRPELMGR